MVARVTADTLLSNPRIVRLLLEALKDPMVDYYSGLAARGKTKGLKNTAVRFEDLHKLSNPPEDHFASYPKPELIKTCVTKLLDFATEGKPYNKRDALCCGVV